MASNDAEVFNLLERAVSGDLNDLQSIETRVLANLLRYGEAKRIVAQIPEGPRNVVMGGLIASPSGGDVSISPGVLAQDSATLPPVPGGLDSPYRLARLDVATVVVLPAPGIETFYLVEAQMVQVITLSSLRDIYNPGTQVFAPALVTKQVQNQIQFQVVAGAGGNAPAPSGGNWVPLCVVDRPPGGPPVLPFHIIDVRPIHESGRQRPLRPEIQKGLLFAGVGNLGAVSLEAFMDGPAGALTYDLPIPGTDPGSVGVLSPSTALAANGWYYLYLCPWSAQVLRPTFQGGFILQRTGVLVCSDVAPNFGQAGGNIDLPPPWGVTQCLAENTYFIGALRRDAANTGWVPMQSADLHHFDMLAGVNVVGAIVIGAPLAPPSGDDTVIPAAGQLPDDVRGFQFNLLWAGAAGGTALITLAVSPTSSAQFVKRLALVDDNFTEFADFDVQTGSFGGTTFHLLVVSPGPVNAGTIARMYLSSFDY